jgi:MYXO-CTERM domain-containing protein
VSSRLLLAVPTVIVSLALTFAPVFAQDAGPTTGNAGADARGTTAAADNDRDRGPDLGWLGLLGIVGLAGLMRRDRHDRTHGDRAVNR